MWIEEKKMQGRMGWACKDSGHKQAEYSRDCKKKETVRKKKQLKCPSEDKITVF